MSKYLLGFEAARGLPAPNHIVTHGSRVLLAWRKRASLISLGETFDHL